MKEIRYDQLNEVIYTETLKNGLQVILHPKPDFHKTYALFSTDFGSIDQEFIPLGKSEAVKMPDGIAHFLEHKMFEKEDGDIFHTFSKQGASANAFTSFTKTAYLFSSTSHVKENLQTLLDFVQTPYFTEETVNKEKGIIAQEIQMYDDEPDWRLFFGLIQNLFPNHPVKIDIAGTVESIQEITADMLYENYHTFYHPSNMKLFITGQINPEETIAWIRENQDEKVFEDAQKIERVFPENSMEVIPSDKLEMDISRPKVAVGIRGTKEHPKDIEALRFVLGMEFLLKCLFGQTSTNYLTLYDEGVIDDSFSFDFTFDRTFDFLTVSTDTKDPEAFASAIKNLLLTAKESPELNEEHFEVVKKRSIGQVLQAMNSLEYIAHRFNDSVYGSANVFDIVPIMEELTLDYIQTLAEEYMKEENYSLFTIMPK
jgi:predicted Zn-dependent peptidase